MDTSRIVSIIVQYGVGALLCAAGIWAGLRSGYLNLGHREDKRLVTTVLVGFVLLLAFSILFTLVLPHWPSATEPGP